MELQGNCIVNRVFNVTTVFGRALRFSSLRGHEEISRLFELTLLLKSEQKSFAPQAILGTSVTLEMELAGGARRHLYGQCMQFAQVGKHGRHYLYQALLKPWLWYGTRRSDYRIFQNMTAPDVAYPGQDHLDVWSAGGALKPGQYMTHDYNFTMPRSDLAVRRDQSPGHAHGSYEIFDYPGGYTNLSDGDENSSCWIRVSSPWAGSNFGGIQIPRIGQEVLVDYLNDPDRPVITSRLYNAFQMPPWQLPGNAMQSGFLIRSSLGGGYENAEALRFEDKKGEEQLWIPQTRTRTSKSSTTRRTGSATTAARPSTATRPAASSATAPRRWMATSNVSNELHRSQNAAYPMGGANGSVW